YEAVSYLPILMSVIFSNHIGRFFRNHNCQSIGIT
ncbi:MAG: hypothetical protein ACI831_001055, partial [Candidatus Azotimanducaceae bacterium]